MKYAVLAVSVAVQVCLGGVYAWTTFVPPLKQSYGFSTAQTQLVFGVLIAVFTLTMVAVGRLVDRRGPRLLLVASGVLFAAGYGPAAVSGGSFWLVLAGVGVLSGAATGLGYVCPLTTSVRWFPEHKGLVTGIAVAGFGGGASVSLFAAGNAVGRIVWGAFIDRFRERIVSISLAAFAVVLAALWLLPHREPLFLALVFLAGASFGACFVVYAALTASCYGAEHLGAVYPYIFLSYGIAGIAGPALGGWLHDTSGSYALALAASIALLVQGILAHAVLERTARNQCCPTDSRARDA